MSIFAQLAEEINADQAIERVLDPEYIAEQKLDGHRVLLQATGSGMKGLNRNGTTYSAKGLPLSLVGMRLPEGLVIDGELLDLSTLQFWAFDLRSTDGSIDQAPLAERRELLEGVISKFQLEQNGMRVVPQARTTEEKQRLLTRALNARAEGVVFKRADMAADNGGRTWSKFKFIHSADCVVTEVRPNGKDSATLALWTIEDGLGKMVEVGHCSLIGKEAVAVGDVVEVAYLYATKDDRLYQPRMLRKRTDKKAGECELSQLIYTKRDVIDLS